MILQFIVFICVCLFILSIMESRTHGMGSHDGVRTIPNYDMMSDTKSKCAPPPCQNPTNRDKRDLGIALPGCTKIFIESNEEEKKPEKNFYQREEEEFLQYRMTIGAEKPFRDVYDSYERLHQAVYQTPKNTRHEKTQNPRNRNYLTTTY